MHRGQGAGIFPRLNENMGLAPRIAFFCRTRDEDIIVCGGFVVAAGKPPAQQVAVGHLGNGRAARQAAGRTLMLPTLIPVKNDRVMDGDLRHAFCCPEACSQDQRCHCQDEMQPGGLTTVTSLRVSA